MVLLAACEKNTHTHNYATLKFDNKSHWFECECEEKSNVTLHNIKNGECICGYVVPHSHEYTILKNNETLHWYECICGNKSVVESHNGGTATCNERAVCSICSESYGELEEHNYATLKNNETTHWYECVCGDTSDIEFHKGGTATCAELAVCSVCNIKYGEYSAHQYESKWTYNETYHWHKSTCDCGAKTDFERHTLENSDWCTVCEQVVLPTNGIYYKLSADGSYAAVIAYLGTSTRVNIASTYNGVPVTSIYPNAFENTSITTVIIPDSVTSIGYDAFSGCTSLTSVVIGDNVTSIGNYAFFNCRNLTSVTIGDSVISIGNCAFYRCSSLTSVVIGNSTTSIGNSAFSCCNSLAGVVIGDSVTSIGNYAFYKCSSLTSVYISDIAAWCNISLDDIYANPLHYAENLYLNNQLVTKLVIPDNVTSISYGVFSGCKSLTSIVIPDSVTSIGDYAFLNCSNLTSMVIGNSVSSIGDSAFRNCTTLTSIVIPDSVTDIDSYSFYGCSNLTSVYYKGAASNWAKISMGSYNSNLTNATRYYYSKEKPTTAGNYWHYNEYGNIVVW